MEGAHFAIGRSDRRHVALPGVISGHLQKGVAKSCDADCSLKRRVTYDFVERFLVAEERLSVIVDIFPTAITIGELAGRAFGEIDA